MKNLIPFLLIALLSFQFGCASNDSAENTTASYDMTAKQGGFEEIAMSESAEEQVQSDASYTKDRKIIKSGNVTFETKDLGETHKKIVASTEKSGGFVANESVSKGYDRLSHSLTVRVPAEKFDFLLSEIIEGVEFFDQKNISVSDVTAQHIDLTARLNTKKELEARYLALLSKAHKVQDLLEISESEHYICKEI